MASAEHQEALYRVAVLPDVMAACRDGVRLAADVYLPCPPAGGLEDGSWPAILQRTPYDKRAMAAEARFFAERGYAVVIQDVRGRFASEGAFEPFVREPADGVDTVAWVRGQSWCNGRIGTTGTSYLACTQMALGALDPPGLAAQFVSQGFSNYHTTRSRRGGAYEHHRTHWLFRMARDSKEAAADPALRRALDQAWANLADWLSLWPLRRGHNPLSGLPTYEQALLDFMTRADYDRWWHNPALSLEPHYDVYADVPAYLLGSWYDPYAVAVTDNYAALAERKQGPIHLIMGPWVHGVEALGQTAAGDVEFGPAAALAYNELRLAWFDRWLRPDEPVRGVTGWPAVRLFVMGGGSGRRTATGRLEHGGEWRDQTSWPPPNARPHRLYLQPDGGLAMSPPGDGDTAATTYTFDPRDPQPSAPDPRQPHEAFPRGGFDVRGHRQSRFCANDLPLAARHDVLVFATPPLTESVEVTGRVELELYVSSTGADTDFTARLVDWYPPSADYPDGYALELCQTIQRVRYRDSRAAATMMRPGEVYLLKLRLPPTANLFAAGHRIRLDISSSDFPRFDINPNTGEPLGMHRSYQVVQNTVHHGGSRASAVILPVTGV